MAATGVEVRNESRWLNALSVRATRAQLDALAALPMVDRLELVARFRRRAPEPTPAERAAAEQAIAAGRERAAALATTRDVPDYGGSLAGLEQINVPEVHATGITGEGVVIGMLDSGFKTTHEALAGVPVIARHDFIDDDEVVENEPGDPTGQHNHGTQTMSTIMGFADGELVGPAFGASAILAKTEDISDEYPLEEDNWVAGLEWVESVGADVVSSSLGYYDWYEFADLDGNTAVTTIAADLAVGRGVVVVNSAGNERGFGFGHIIAPADGDSVIAVGAVSLDGAIASFSSPGPTYDGRIKPDVSAQGVSNHVVSVYDDQGYASASGTSFSCPLTAGVAALVLSRAPMLTPLQVREALRMTADRADQPDNDFGWGVVDALAAVSYWGATIDHEPLGDTENTTSPIAVVAGITDRLPLDPGTREVVWRSDGGPWQRTPLAHDGGVTYRAELPAQPAGTQVEYYLEVTDSAGITTRLPVAGADAPWAFRVGPDQTPPVLAHTPLGDQPLVTWPPLIECAATDNLGIDRVELSYRLNGGPEQGPFLLDDFAFDVYRLVFPLAASEVAIGDQVVYRLTAYDASSSALSTTTGWLGFEIIDTLGVVLVIDDGGGGLRDAKHDADKNPLPPADGRSAAATIAQWLTAAGYVADVLPADAVTPAAFAGYQAVVYSAGDATTPLASATLRDALSGYVDDGGRLLVEGGEVGYDALSSPGYPAFAASVLHAASWEGDSAGGLQVASGQETHPLMVRPHALPSSIAVAYDSYGDQDAVTPALDATLVMGTGTQAAAAGVLVYDDNQAPQAGQIVYVAASVEAVDAGVGAQLVENALAYLLAAEPPATASIAGTVALAGGGEPTGTTVSLSGRPDVVVGADGAFAFTDLHGGLYTLTASREGFATAVEQIDLADGEALAGLELTLLPVIQVDALATPELSIPDDDPSGVVSTITVGASGPLSGITVDIDVSHTYVGDLTVKLFGPTGVEVTLHDRSGGSADDLQGNWPETLTVDGPGSLADFLGEEASGAWVLHVVDHAGADTGTLHAWGLHLELPDQVTPAVDPPVATRLLGNRPNPFNPRTTLAFTLAHRERVRLSLYDLRGRLVRRLVAGELAAGHHTVIWDGRDGTGQGVASGVYLARFRAGDVAQEHKVMLVR